MYRILALGAFLNLFVSAFPATLLSDSAKISLMTCAPGSELYSIFGHSAIRVKDDFRRIDQVFNYGTFDFDTPNFYLKFANGNLNYMLASNQFRTFLRNYFYEKRSVWEQELNLNQQEKQRLYEAIVENIKPENRLYRYDFFFDNCATRIRDIVCENLDGQVTYVDSTGQKQTFRDFLHEYDGDKPWIRDGLDIILGSGTDRMASPVEQMFLPDYLMLYFGKAEITDDQGNRRSLVQEMKPVLRFEPVSGNAMAMPQTVFWGLCLLSVLLLVYEIRIRKKPLILVNRLVFMAVALVGLLIVFLWLFTRHMVCGDNFNILWASPLYLLPALLPARLFKTQVLRYTATILAAGQCITILAGPFLPQYMPSIVLPLALILLIRLASAFRYPFR